MRSRWIVGIAAFVMLVGAPALAHDHPSHHRLQLPPMPPAPQKVQAPRVVQQEAHGSECLAMARALPRARYASLDRKLVPVAARDEEVLITYAGHSTYMIETAGGVTIGTDFSGAYTAGKLPTVVTMNRAHSTHYTLSPDPRIGTVLHGWGEGTEPARHNVMIGDVLIRNVTTDIRAFRFDSEALQKDGNSIFIFEVAGLCIGHLGHLHHPLEESQFAAIGRLDIVMVPIDGGYTMSVEGMSDIAKRMRSSIILPMHRFGTPLSDFQRRMGAQFEMDMRPSRWFKVSLGSLPKQPTIIVLDGV